MTMKLSRILVAALLAASATLSSHAQHGNRTSTEQEMSRAIMQVYNDEIAADPTAYEALYRRAAIYYNDGLYLRALQDVDNAIRYIPTSETDLRAAALSLRANIHTMQQQYQQALDDLRLATELVQDDYILSYQRANAEYECGNYADAKTWYQRLRRLNPRSVEGLVGLSRVAVRENNLGLANDYIDQAVEIAPNNADSYLRRASVRRQLGNNNGAAQDYISALSLGETSRAVNGLVELADTDYPATISALSDAISQASDVALFYYLRGIIAMGHYHYTDALTDLQTLIDKQMYSYAGVHDAIASCQYALGRYEQALQSATQATRMAPDTAAYMVTLANIYLAMGDTTRAYEAAAEAHRLDVTDASATQAYAFAALADNKTAQASELFGEAIFDHADRPDNYVYRAYILADKFNDRDGAHNLYSRLNELNIDETVVSGLRGFALLGNGDTDGARRWADVIKTQPDPHGRNNYLLACLYARLGDNDAAIDCVERALNAGYANYHDWTRADNAPISVAPLREDSRLNALLARFASIF